MDQIQTHSYTRISGQTLKIKQCQFVHNKKQINIIHKLMIHCMIMNYRHNAWKHKSGNVIRLATKQEHDITYISGKRTVNQIKNEMSGNPTRKWQYLKKNTLLTILIINKGLAPLLVYLRRMLFEAA